MYNNPQHHSGLTLLLATIFFAFQIYCDFSAYSDIAIGTAKVMGFKLMTNFNRPYFSRNISEFWKRWHISLSTWFTDYLYISLGGNRVTIPRWYFNLIIVFVLRICDSAPIVPFLNKILYVKKKFLAPHFNFAFMKSLVLNSHLQVAVDRL